MNYYQLVQEARQFSILAHKEQKYGAYPYDIHLGHVVEVLIRNAVGFYSEEDYTLLAVAWLHDILEDTNTSKEQLNIRFNINIAEIVYALTDGKGNTRKEKKEEVYKKIIYNQEAIIVKLADRIANVEFSLIHGNIEKIKKYYTEQKDLEYYIKPNISTNLGKILFEYLEKIFTNNIYLIK